MKKIALFGAGKIGKRVYNQLAQYNVLPICFVDNNEQRWGTQYCEIPVIKPEELLNIENIIICIATLNYDEIRLQLVSLGIADNNICNELELAVILFKNERDTYQFVDNYSEFQEKWSILFDCSGGLGLGGVETWSFQFGNALLEDGYEVYLLTEPTKNHAPGLLKDRVVQLDIESPGSYNKTDLEKTIRAILTKLPCVLITSVIGNIFLAGQIIKEYLPDKIKFISAIHSDTPRIFDQHMKFEQSTDMIIAVSEEIKEAMLQRGMSTDKVRHLLTPIECEKQLIRTYSTENIPIKLAYGGRLVIPYKRVDLLIPLIEELERLQINYIFDIAGKGNYENELRIFIEKNALGKKVRLLGYIARSQMLEFWRAHDVFINVSDSEGNCLSLVEAMANGMIPISTRVVGTKERIENGYNGYIVDCEDMKELAKKIKHLSKRRISLPIFGSRSNAIIYKTYQEHNPVRDMEEILSFHL